MNISLTSELKEFIQNKVDSRMYQTASEVVRQALRVMQRQEAFDQARLEGLRQDVQAGVDQLERAECVEIRNEKDRRALLDRVRRDGRARLAAKHKKRRSA